MKKLLTLAALLGTATVSFAQGYVSFANGSTSRVSTNGTLQAASPAGNWYYALLVAPSTQNTLDSSSFAGWALAATGTNTGVAGRLSGNNFDNNQAVAVNAPGYSGSSTADFVVVGWSANIGTDWNLVRAGWLGSGSAAQAWAVQDPTKPGGAGGAYFGWSVVANDILLAPALSSYNNVFGPTTSGQIPSLAMQFYSVPEPSTMALAGLGAAALVIFRRRKV